MNPERNLHWSAARPMTDGDDCVPEGCSEFPAILVVGAEPSDLQPRPSTGSAPAARADGGCPA
ncbi:hypothetical protein IscW_ISCW001100 [Ixodes scapularis]|uniref:Uncharacterized protein n=1 Tax=Ixodes scapularis TaxID=6945 RepID=B7P6P9_IXOSC|nr:hypothetical protein IscW_ISCW001100 [Ixodes scapularis]|eukprot:XP_002409074.1 hypothetical protein IscW_ISCW001100 [Ixodes scapularis]